MASFNTGYLLFIAFWGFFGFTKDRFVPATSAVIKDLTVNDKDKYKDPSFRKSESNYTVE